MSPLIVALIHVVTVWWGPTPALARHVRELGGETYLQAIGGTMQREADARGFDSLLLGMVAFSESSLNPDALGAAGETGLLQLNPRSKWGRAAAAECKRTTRRECLTTVSIRWGAAALQHGLRLCGTEAAAVSWFKSGNEECLEGPKGRAVVAMRDRMRALGGGS